MAVIKIGNSALFLGVFFLFSCGSLVNDPLSLPQQQPNYRLFWAEDFRYGNRVWYQLEADLLAPGSYCNVWAERGSGVSEATAQAMAKAYDSEIYPKITGVFSFTAPVTTPDNTLARNTMEYSGWMTKGDGKINILLLDIKDGYTVEGGYIAGYFWAGNYEYFLFASNGGYNVSNQCAMIYVDTNPGEPGSAHSNITVAHELQHLMNYVNDWALRNKKPMDTWVNEGLSSAAEWVFSGKYDRNRLDWFKSSEHIKKGNNFFVWGNHIDEDPNAILDDYATVNMFFQWLRLQKGDPIYTSIATSRLTNHGAVTNAAGYNNWETMLEAWLRANYVNDSSGPFGYMNEPTLKDIRANFAPGSVNSYLLYPGEAVYSQSGSDPNMTGSGNINYVFLSGSNALLTYNFSSNINGLPEPGKTTGLPVGMILNRQAAAQPSRPYAISADDMRKRNNSRGEAPSRVRPWGAGR